MSLLVVAFRVVDAQTLLRRWCWRIRSSRTPATASSRRRSADRPFPAMLSEKYVEQVGHRFVVAVVLATVVAGLAHAQCPDGSPPPCRSATVAAPSPTSLAVLYFDNASPDSTDDYLAEGLTEAIIAQLGQVGRISVKSRSAGRRFRGANVPDPPVIGRALGVAYLVTGSVQRADRALRVTIELAHATTGMRVWGDQFRSEEHTSELQSQSNLVCRLLLEKKKNKNKQRSPHATPQLQWRSA